MSGETEDQVSGWTVDTVKAHFERRLADQTKLLDERYATQTKAVDAAFLAQQKAMETAFLAADRAVQTALQSAEKAVQKAEMANEKRFEAANEWRGQSADRERSQQEQLANLTATLLPREVAEAQFNELRKIAQTALDTAKAADSKAVGAQTTRAGVVAVIGLVLTVLIVVVAAYAASV